jgi:O-acetyl-ADP-ribose deacetylase (regulator of RNase III)
MITKYLTSDITETELEYIAHGVNCQNTMKSGVALALFTKWSDVKTEYHKYFEKSYNHGKQPYEYLGSVQKVEVENKTIFNLFTQETYGYDGVRRVNYSAVASTIKNLRNYGVKRLAIPKIGCGLAGGNWTFMEQLINDAVGEYIEVWVYDNSTAKPSGKNDNA